MTTIETLIKDDSKTVIPHSLFELCGKHSTAAILNQIVYWFGTSKRTGKTRITPDENGERWLAKAAKDWYRECQVKLRTAQRAIAQLKALGVIETKIKKWGGVPMTYIRLLESNLSELLNPKLNQTEPAEKPKNFEQPASLSHSDSRHNDTSSPPTCHSGSRHDGGVLYKESKTTNNNYNNSFSQTRANEFQNFITSLWPEERESFDKFVDLKIAELPRKVVLRDEWLMALTGTGKPRWEAMRQEWEGSEQNKIYAKSIIPTGVDPLAKSFVDKLARLTSPFEVQRNMTCVTQGKVFGVHIEEPLLLETLVYLNLKQIKAMLNWRDVGDIDGEKS